MATQTMLQVETATTLARPNIPKHGIGHSAFHVVFDYNASNPPTPRSAEPGSHKVGLNSVRGQAAAKGEVQQAETPLTVDTTASKTATRHTSSMPRNGVANLSLNLAESLSFTEPPLAWDWDIEHEDRQKERKADSAMRDTTPFEVDRRLLKEVVREKMGIEVGRIKFLSAGTFHKAYLVTLVNREQLVARVARRFMPRLKTESEVATMSYLREKTTIPVPRIYHYDSNPYNRLGGEFILMSKAPGIPLSRVYHGLSYGDLFKLIKNLASLTIQLYAHRFTDIGSLYFGPDPRLHAIASGTPTPKATLQHYSGFPFSPTIGPLSRTPSMHSVHTVTHNYHVGPIISWPFFGSNRGDLIHPTELNRGPWPTTVSYLESCVEREINGVLKENEGSAAPHRLHLDPDEIHSSWHHKLRAVPGDESDDSDEYDLEESDEEWEGPGSAMYRDYRRMQRSTFLVAHLNRREAAVKREMGRWKQLTERLVEQVEKDGVRDEFGLDCHDLSLENVFVDEHDHTKITCVIDWESTTTRPLWACAHLPACFQSSPFVAKLFRQAIAELPSDPHFRVPSPPPHPKTGRPLNVDPAHLCREWLYYEATGARLRMAHRCAEWDGWEEGLVDSILGPEEIEKEWFNVGNSEYDHESLRAAIASPGHEHESDGEVGLGASLSLKAKKDAGAGAGLSRDRLNGSGGGKSGRANGVAAGSRVRGGRGGVARGAASVLKQAVKLPFIAEEHQKEKMLNTTGDICGGRGGELGRRLEAWLTVTGGNEGETLKKWNGEVEDEDGVQHAEGPASVPETRNAIGLVGR